MIEALGMTLVLIAAVAQAPRASAPVQRIGEFVWHDLVTDDPAASRAFYGALFGWTFQPGQGVEPNYLIIKQDGYPIGGIVTIAKTNALPQWLSYVMVADVDRATVAFGLSGGKIYRAPLDVRKDLRVAVVGDAQGAPLGLASRGRELPTTQVPPVHRWLWMEYLAVDAPGALDFYGRTVGYTSDVLETRARHHARRHRRADATARRAERLAGHRAGSHRAPLALQKFPFDRQTRPNP